MTPTVAVSEDLRERLSPIRSKLAEALGAADAPEVWLVGGIVRDAVIDRPLLDIDLAIAGDPEAVARALARTFGGTPFALGDRPGDSQSCWRVAPGGSGVDSTQYDVCALRAGSLQTDLSSRDFTVNALAVPVRGPWEVVDQHGGLEDIASRTVRMVAPEAFDDDPLRMLRAARIAHTLGWSIDPETVEAIRARAARASEPAGERTFAELRQLLLHPEARRGWTLLESLGLGAVLLPELETCRGVDQSRFHHLDVHDHTLAVLDNCEDLLEATSFWLPLPDEPGLRPSPWDEHARLVVLLAALCHDLAKPATRAVLEDGRVSFAGHDEVGMDVVDAVAARWRLPGSLRRGVRRLVGTHLALGYLLHGDRSARERWQFLRLLEPVAAEAIVLSVGDRLATAGPADRRRWVRAHLEMARTLWLDHWREQRDGVPVPLLDGSQIAEAAGLEPGRQLGELVAALAEAQAVGGVDTIERAREFVRSCARGDVT